LPSAPSRTPSPQIVSAVSDSPQLITVPLKSFAATLGGHCSSPLEEAPYPVPCIKGDALSIRIGQDEYSKGLAECQYALRGRMTLNKGDKPYITRDLASKLGKFWKMVHQWKMVSLGRGYYDFLFEHPDDLSRIWTAGNVSLHSGLLRISQWTKDFNLRNKLMLQYGLGLLSCLRNIGVIER